MAFQLREGSKIFSESGATLHYLMIQILKRQMILVTQKQLKNVVSLI